MTAPDCRNPAACPVPDPSAVNLSRLSTKAVDPGEMFHSVYDTKYTKYAFNESGAGNARFSPITDTAGTTIGTVYLARRRTVALLETVFHDIGPIGARHVTNAELKDKGIRSYDMPERVLLADLTNAGLTNLETNAAAPLQRHQIVATTAAHYPCTRQWAETLHARKIGGKPVAGIIWDSRVAEIALSDHHRPLIADLLDGDNSEVIVLFADRVTAATPADFNAFEFAPMLHAGTGADLIDDVVHQLGATITRT